MQLAVTAALISAHKVSKIKDKDSITTLKDSLKSYSKTTDESSLIYAARYFYHEQKEKQSRQCLEKILSKNNKSIEALVLLGWINLESGNSRNERKSAQMFDAAVQLAEMVDGQQGGGTGGGGAGRDFAALLGRVKYNEMKKKYDRCIEDLNLLIVSSPEFLPAQVEKSRILMILNNWDESLAIANRILKRDHTHILALKQICIYFLTRESKVNAISSRLSDLIAAIQQNEPTNARLFYSVSQLCSRLAIRRKPILQQTLSLIDRACKLDPQNSHYLCEQAYQLQLLEEFGSAIPLYQSASKLDEGNLSAIHGLIKIKILQSQFKEARQELEFLSEIQSSLGSSMELTFLQALLAWYFDKNQTKTLEYLSECLVEHGKMMDSTPVGTDAYFITYNPDFVLEMIQQLMAHIGSEPMQTGDPPNPTLKQCISTLTTLVSMIPGLLQAQLLLAKTNFIAGEFEIAERALNVCTRLDPQCATTCIIQAQIYLAREQYKMCSQSLETGRGLDFEIRNTSIYYLMKAKLLEASGQVEDALKVLQSAMELPGVKKAAANPSAKSSSTSSSSSSFTATSSVALHDRISIFLHLAAVLTRLNQLPEAVRVMTDAKAEFKGTSESGRLILAESELAIKRRDYDFAIAQLRTIPSDNTYYTRSKIRLAKIYLEYKKNRKQYILQFQDLAYGNNTVHTYLLLGEAYMQIQEPEEAIKAYEAALQLNPDDPQLSSKIGRALITTHDYARAVKYYENAAKNDPSKVYLLHELAELYLSLKNYDQAIRVLEQVLHITRQKRNESNGTSSEDFTPLFQQVKSYSLLTDVFQGMTNYDGVRDSLQNAWNLQMEILSSLSSDNADLKREQRDIAAVLCYRLAEFYKSINDSDKSLLYYNESLKHNEGHEKARLALAKLHLQNGDLDACQSQCVTLMRMDQNNKEASLMLADLMFRKNEHEAATYHFQQLLEKNPTRYDALNKLIHLLRRAGSLAEAPRFIKLAEKFSPKAAFAPGLHYCRGAYAWFINDPREALIQFNSARKDGEWGKLAIQNMIEIYLNPDHQELFAESAEAKGDNSEHIVAAEKLLKDLTKLGEGSSPKYIVLEAYALMATKQKPQIEKALERLLACCQPPNDNYVPALLGMANAFVLLNQPAKARNQLKRISKLKYDSDYATEFERSWLMLADIYISVNKYEFAQELCKKCLTNNKSSAKSWEMLGLIMEKEQSYRDAADNYEHAFHFMNESSAPVGFKLAFNYLKAKRYVEAIDVCNKVLTTFPDYPKIKKEILEKARASLRP